MALAPSRRPVFSTDRSHLCPTCGWPAHDCRCARRFEEALPARIVAKLRIEKGGRGGKSVTVIDALPRNAEFLAKLCSDLKRACGAGGTISSASDAEDAAGGAIEIQGDQRERIRALLVARGFVVRG